MTTDRSKGGKFLYKCRLCGSIRDTVFSPDWLSSLVWAMNGLDLNSKATQDAMAPTSTDICHCVDGRVGVSDLVGVVPGKNEVDDEA